MPSVELTEILISARQESNRMRHYFIGAEHLFIALLEIRGGLLRGILEEQGLTPDYVSDAIRRKVGKGGQRRLWAGTPSTPRANIVLDIATDLALEDGRSEANERDLLTAIIEEADNMPARVLKALGVDMTQMYHLARTRELNRHTQQPYVAIDFSTQFNSPLSDEQLLILRRMFYGHARIRVESQLTGGYSDALVLMVTPVHADSREDAPVIVKIADTDDILDEAQRYDSHVRGILPPLTARLEGRPVAPEIADLAGIYYTIVATPGQSPRDLRAAAPGMDSDILGNWLKQQLYMQFGRTWWQQRRPFRFHVWTEYDWLLPPVLILQAMPEDTTPDHVLRVPISRTRLAQIDTGDIVALENFTIQHLDHNRNRIRVISGRGNEATRRAHKIEVNGLNLKTAMHFRGEVIERVTGRVWQTRQEALHSAVDILNPPFDLHSAYIHLHQPDTHSFVNPLLVYDELLHYHINGSTSKIHGDLHLGNIIVGPNNSAFLIDFAHARDGHTLFDWATLEISFLSDFIMPQVGETWDDAIQVLAFLVALNAQKDAAAVDSDIASICQPLVALREIVADSLATPGQWGEYYVALALCALRAVSWETTMVGSRRLMFLVAALAVTRLRDKPTRRESDDATSPDETADDEDL